MTHRNARLTPITRLELVREVEAGWPQAEVARRFRVSRPTVGKWVRRYAAHGEAGLADRGSAPHRHPRRTPPELERDICAVRRSQGFGPHRIGWALGLAHQTVYAVLRRFGLHRLDRLHRVTREIARYEHPAPGDLLHLDVKNLPRIPHGRGHLVHGRPDGAPRARGRGAAAEVIGQAPDRAVAAARRANTAEGRRQGVLLDACRFGDRRPQRSHQVPERGVRPSGNP